MRSSLAEEHRTNTVPCLGFRDGQPVQLDDVRVTPIGVEHSAKDAYMFLIQAEGKNVLYTGDFRASEKALAAVRERPLFHRIGHKPLDILVHMASHRRLEQVLADCPAESFRHSGEGLNAVLIGYFGCHRRFHQPAPA